MTMETQAAPVYEATIYHDSEDIHQEQRSGNGENEMTKQECKGLQNEHPLIHQQHAHAMLPAHLCLRRDCQLTQHRPFLSVPCPKCGAAVGKDCR